VTLIEIVAAVLLVLGSLLVLRAVILADLASRPSREGIEEQEPNDWSRAA
jgi:hypothetical protein